MAAAAAAADDDDGALPDVAGDLEQMSFFVCVNDWDDANPSAAIKRVQYSAHRWVMMVMMMAIGGMRRTATPLLLLVVRTN
jgi:hypothetical protein